MDRGTWYIVLLITKLNYKFDGMGSQRVRHDWET